MSFVLLNGRKNYVKRDKYGYKKAFGYPVSDR